MTSPLGKLKIQFQQLSTANQNLMDERAQIEHVVRQIHQDAVYGDEHEAGVDHGLLGNLMCITRRVADMKTAEKLKEQT